MSEKKTENASGATKPNVANPGCRCQREEMKFRTLLRRWAGSLLGLVTSTGPCAGPGSTGPRTPNASCTVTVVNADPDTEQDQAAKLPV